MEQINLFIEAIETDSAFGEEIHALTKDGKFTEVIKAAAQKGFTITEAELREHLVVEGAETGNSASGELTEEDLENVAGGQGDYDNPYRSLTCWFKAPGDFNRCDRISCTKLVEISLLKFRWFKCSCHGTPACVDKVHHMRKACK